MKKRFLKLIQKYLSRSNNKVNTGPIKGSLDESFQNFVKKNNLLNQEGFFGPGGYRGANPEKINFNIKKSNPKSVQLDLFKNKKRGGGVGPNGVL